MTNSKTLSIKSFDDGAIYHGLTHPTEFQLCREYHLKKTLPLTTLKDGQILEFGVFSGKTISIIAKYFDKEVIWGFDSFEGLPEDWDVNSGATKWKKGCFGLKELPKVPANVELVKGWFNESLPIWLKNNDKKPIKFLHVDCDLYSSTKTLLSMLNNLIIKGTIIIFDEMYSWGGGINYTLWKDGEYKALKEWMEENNREFKTISRNMFMQCAIQITK